MSKTFQLDIITPTEVICEEGVEYLRAPSTDGLFGVQASHAPATIALGIGEIKVTKNGQDSFYATNGGFADIHSNKVLLLVEAVESYSDIDIERAKSAKDRAEKRIKENQYDTLRAKLALERAHNRLKISSI